METAIQELKKILGGRAKEQEVLARYTTFKIGGPADLFFEAKTSDELTMAITSARQVKVPVFILGGGSNILIGDGGIRGLVIKNNTQEIVIKGAKGSITHGVTKKGNVYVEADSGVSMNKLIRFAIEEGLGGLEAQLGLPGSVGGAMYMNSKWTHPEGYVGDSVYQVTLVTVKGNLTAVPRSYFQFGYDSSVIQKTGDIVIKVVFELHSGSRDDLWKVANESIMYRRATQPQGVFSSGCIFRNISKAEAMRIPTPNYTTSAGFLIDHSGLKDTHVGDAFISPMHANFIINSGHAKASDVVQLIELAKDTVKSRFGVSLQEEVVRVGEF